MNSIREDKRLRRLLDRLHALSLEQDVAIDRYYADGADRPTGFEDEASPGRAFWLDKFVALERDKAEFVYALARAGGAHRIVEAGTSFGVSTLYLAAAVKDNGGGTVTSCDIEPSKSAVAGRYLDEVGLRELVDLRVGDVRSTLRDLDEPIDLLLLDIWAPIAGHVVELVGPKLRPGGVVIADNTAVRRALYEGLFAVLDDPASGFTTQTLPFDGGLELAVKTGVATSDPQHE